MMSLNNGLRRSVATWCLAATMLCGMQGIVAAQPAAVAPDPLVTVTPEFTQTLQKLSSDDFKERQAATRHLEMMLGNLSARLVLTDDAEAQAHIADVMRFEGGLAAWMTSVLALPMEQRSRVLKWGLEPAHLTMVAHAYSPLADERMKAAHELGALDDHEASALVAMLLADSNRDVHLAAMDAIWDRPPTPEAVDALWNRAVVSLMEQMRPRMGMMNAVAPQFHGQPLRGGIFDYSLSLRALDADVATRLLLHGNSPLVADKVIAILQQEAADPAHATHVSAFLPYNSSQNFESLLQGFKTNKAIVLLYEIATSPVPDPANGTIGGKMFRWNSRTEAMLDLIEMTGQDPGDYQFKKNQMFQNQMVLDNETDEKSAEGKLTAWWAGHHEQFDGGAAPQTAAIPTTAP